MNIHNIALVRATNIIPFDGIMYPISEIPYLIKKSGTTAFSFAIYDMLIKNGILKETDWQKSEEEQEMDDKENNKILEQYLPYNSDYNSMVLWSINGIVPDDSEHGFGNNTFSNKDCAVIDGLEEQIERSQIISLAPTDAAIKGIVKLSSNAIILIKKCRYEKLTEEEKTKLTSSNITIKIFEGSLKDEIEKVLRESNRYTAETLSLTREHNGFIESDTSEQLIKTLSEIANNKNISQALHMNILLGKVEQLETLDCVKDEYENIRTIMRFYNIQFLEYLFSKLDINNKIKAQCISHSEGYPNPYMKKLCDEIEKIGIDEYKKTVNQYNKQLELLREQGKLPTPQQIVDSVKNNVKIDISKLINELTEIVELKGVVNASKKENISAENCPADAIREYIEKIIQGQQEYIKNGKEVPDEMKVPRQIILTPQNIQFLMDSEYVDYIGAGETGNEIQFFWKKVDEIPALEVRVKREENGKFYLTYIKEEASKEKDEFLWDRESVDGKKGIITVSKKEEALEDICDMDRNR